MTKRQMIADLIAKRSAARDEATKLVDTARSDNERSLTDDEKAKFDGFETDIRGLDERLAELDTQVRADDAAADMQKRYAPSVDSVVEPEIYRSGPGGNSYFRDLYSARNKGDRNATERLLRNDKARAQTRAISTTNGAGGEFVPPLWLEDQFLKLARPGRVTANLIPNMPLPAGTDSINIPKITTGTAVAPVTTQNTAITQTDLATSSISSSVTTIAGGQTISLQLLEQSPLNIDDVVLGDLAAAYAVQYNSLVLSGSGTAGQPTGLMTLSGTNVVAVDNTGLTASQLYAHVADAIQQVHTKRFLPPDTIVMHPRRWAWLVAQVDTTGRPLVTPRAGAYNPLGAADNVASQGLVGEMQGLPVYVDALIPTNLALDTGTGEDAILVMRCADLIQWESHVRAEAFEQTYANQMSVFIRLYNYMSFQPGRYPASISKLTGSGLIAPIFAPAS